jgi:hypothetical protein
LLASELVSTQELLPLQYVGVAGGQSQAPPVQTNGEPHTLQFAPQWFESVLVLY